MQLHSIEQRLSPFVHDKILLRGMSNTIFHGLQSSPCFLSEVNYGGDCGLIISSSHGGGKTCILQSLSELSEVQTHVMNSSNLTHDLINLRVLLDQSGLDSHKSHLILIDDIDSIFAVDSLLCTIDRLSRLSPHCYWVATSSSEDLSAQLTNSYRLGAPVVLPMLSLSQRQHMLMDMADNIVSSFNTLSQELSVTNESNTKFCHDIIWEIAVRTQGFSCGELLKVMRTFCQDCLVRNQLREKVTPVFTDMVDVLPTVSANSLLLDELGNSPSFPPETLTSLMGVGGMQKRLLSAVFSPFMDVGLLSSQKKGTNKLLYTTRLCTGILICGPSGSGKTALATWLACAAQRHYRFISVPCADLVHKVVGETERSIANIFAAARKMGPCFVLLDNLDSVFGQQVDDGSEDAAFDSFRSERTAHKAIDRLLSALLVEIDGLNSRQTTTAIYNSHKLSDSKAVIVIATAQSKKTLNRALTRPGRLEEHIDLALPNKKLRKQYLMGKCKALTAQSLQSYGPTKASGMCNELLDQHLGEIASRSEGKSFSDLDGLFREAAVAICRGKLSLDSGAEGDCLGLICTHLLESLRKTTKNEC